MILLVKWQHLKKFIRIRFRHDILKILQNFAKNIQETIAQNCFLQLFFHNGALGSLGKNWEKKRNCGDRLFYHVEQENLT